MNPRDFVYDQTFKAFIKLGYTERESSGVACDAVRLWARNGRGVDAVSEAIQKGRRTYKKGNCK